MAEKYSKVKIIDHKVIFKGFEEFLPVFNSNSIETMVYKIPDLSEHFIYFNDDLFLIKETKPSDFFRDGNPVLRGKWSRFDADLVYKKVGSFLGKKTSKNKQQHTTQHTKIKTEQHEPYKQQFLSNLLQPSYCSA